MRPCNRHRHRRRDLLWLIFFSAAIPCSGQAQTDTPAAAPQAQAQSTQQQQPTAAQRPAPAPNVTSDEDLKKEEKQRILGVVPNFNVTYNFSSPALSSKQKWDLALHTNFDAVTVVASALTAGSNELGDQFKGYGWGPAGYFKRFGAAYADNFDGVLWGSAILPILFRQDPRYFRLGTGTLHHRLYYSIATTVICKSDKTRHWMPNYSNVLGNFVSGGISNVYYPAANRGAGLTVQNALTVTAEGTFGNVFNEFWPDVSHRLFKKKLKKLDIDYDKPAASPATPTAPAAPASGPE